MRNLSRIASLVAVLVLASLPAASANPESDPPEHLRPGDVLVDHGVAITVPQRGIGVFVEAIFPREGISQELLVATEPDGSVTVESYGDESENSEPPTIGPINPFDNGCEDNAYTLRSWKWYSTMNWRFNTGGVPANLTATEATTAVRDGTTNVTAANNDCGLADNITASENYQGTTSTGIQVNSDGTCGTTDGISVVKWGSLTNGSLATTCTWFDTSFNPDKATANDVRISTGFSWENDTVGCIAGGLVSYMIEDVITHERGHAYGLGHVTEADHEWLTMSTNSQGPCDMSQATLGLGDHTGLNVRY